MVVCSEVPAGGLGVAQRPHDGSHQQQWARACIRSRVKKQMQTLEGAPRHCTPGTGCDYLRPPDPMFLPQSAFSVLHGGVTCI